MDLRFCAPNVAHIFLTPGNPLWLLHPSGPASSKVWRGMITLRWDLWCLFLSSCECVPDCVCCVLTCGGQRWVEGVFFSLNLELTSWLYWLARELPVADVDTWEWSWRQLKGNAPVHHCCHCHWPYQTGIWECSRGMIKCIKYTYEKCQNDTCYHI